MSVLGNEKKVRNFENRPLSQREKSKLHMYEREVVQKYESVLKRPFMKDDLISLKRCLQSATPAQINSQIVRFRNQKNFVEFFYLVKPVEQMFKNRRGGHKNDGE